MQQNKDTSRNVLSKVIHGEFKLSVEHQNLRQLISIKLYDILIFWPFCTFEYHDLLFSTWDLRNWFLWSVCAYCWRKYHHIIFPLFKIQKVVIQETPIKIQFFEYPLSTTLRKSEIPIRKCHAANSTPWYGVRSPWIAY